MPKRVSIFLFLITAATLLSDLSAQIEGEPAKFQQQATPDSASQPPDSLTAAKSASFFSRVKKWANDNQGLIALIGLALTILGGAFIHFLLPRIKPRVKVDVDKRDARTRYLDHIIDYHKHLPVAGFETNLRVPIPLENVYVTLLARMPDLTRLRGDSPQDVIEFQNRPDQIVPVQDALKFALNREYDGLVILGYPGSGKTTLMKYFLLCFANNKARENLGLDKNLLPILLFLRQVDPQQSLVANILASFEKYELRVDEQLFLSQLRDGKAILLLDGLDEVPTEEKRAEVSRWIHEKVHRAFHRCPLIVTSRFSGYRGDAVLPEHYLRLEIQDYNLEQIQQFLQSWLTAVETHLHEDNRHWRQEARNRADDLFHRIETAPTLLELAVNPLMLQIIALVHRDRGTLPERRVELYKECTDVLLERWDKAKGLDVLLSAAEARQLLQPVALWMHSVENRREVSKPEILDFIAPILPRIKRQVNSEELLQSWQERSGIFKGEGDIYFFHHLSFQEYLTAEEIRNSRHVEILVKNFDKAWWREPTLLAVGLTNPPIFSDFMTALLRASRGNGGSVDFLLRCIDETLVKEEAPFVQVLRRLKRFEARYQALLALERIGTEAAKVAMMEALQDKDTSIADLARNILAKSQAKPITVKLEPVRISIKGKAHTLQARMFNPHELNSEYILIPGAKEKIVFKSTGKPAPDDPLYFAKYPVTNKLYRRFIDYLAGASREEALPRLPLEQFAQSLLAKAAREKIVGFTKYLDKDLRKWADNLRSIYDDDKRFNGDDQPVVGVAWFAAVAYCHWLTEMQNANAKMKNEKLMFRLPTEEEWEWAASGGKREYPWGPEKPDDTRANYGEKVGHTTPVSAYPAGATPEGLMDMAGNVWEWMENPHPKYKEARALRGGSWDNSSGILRCVARVNFLPDNRWGGDGFRVVCGQS
jgi:formylglycine-generating enzyme required for sulfatase activity